MNSLLPIIPVLQAKMAILAALDQTNRNDLKHLHLMRWVVREYLGESIEAVESESVNSRPVIVQLELASKITSSSVALKCTTSHGIDFRGIWPRELLASAKDRRLQSFVKHRLPSLV